MALEPGRLTNRGEQQDGMSPGPFKAKAGRDPSDKGQEGGVSQVSS